MESPNKLQTKWATRRATGLNRPLSKKSCHPTWLNLWSDIKAKRPHILWAKTRLTRSYSSVLGLRRWRKTTLWPVWRSLPPTQVTKSDTLARALLRVALVTTTALINRQRIRLRAVTVRFRNLWTTFRSVPCRNSLNQSRWRLAATMTTKTS